MGDVLEIIVKLTDKATPQAKALGKTLQGVGTDMVKTGGLMTAGITAPIVALGVKSVMAASDLSESMNKVQVVFGTLGGDMMNWSTTASQALGMTQNQALSAVGTYGNLFRSMGMTEEMSGDMSTSLVELAADLASFNNIDPTEALEKLRAGLTGETEPLKSLGVNLNEAAIKAEALRLGLMKEGEDLSASAKAQAAYSLIMQQTTLAQGDFARTSDGLANSMRIVKAQVGDMSANLGTLLLPMVSSLVTKIQEALTWFQGLSPEMQRTIVIVLGIVAAIGPLILIVGSLITAIGAIIPVAAAVGAVLTGPVLLAILAVVAVVALLYTAWTQNWGGIQEKTGAVINTVKGWIAAGLAFITTTFQTNGANLTGVWRMTWDTVQKLIENARAILTSIVKAIKAAIEGDWRAFGSNLRDAWDKAWESVKEILRTARDGLVEIVTTIVTKIKDKITKTDWKAVGKSIIQGLIDGAASLMQNLINTVVGIAKAAWEAAKGFLKSSSPSKRFMELGRNTMEGFILGLQGQGGMVQAGTVGGVAGSSYQTVFNLTANYPHQSPRDLKTDVQRLNALYGRGRV